MSSDVWGMSLHGILATLSASILVAELAGYILHRVMHSEKLPTLSRAHMIHHFQLYGPNQPMRAKEYKNATQGRASLGNIGMEWIVPAALILAVCRSVMWVLRVSWGYQLLAFATLIGWPFLMFSYLHDRMHVQGFWMERAPILKNWFTKARRLHDIHHRSLDGHGQMDRNFGIGFFFFDRLFGTLAKRHCPFNWYGYRAALRRHRRERMSDEDLTHFPSGYRV